MKKSLILLTLISLLTTQVYAKLTKIRKTKASKITLEQQLANYILYPDALRSPQKRA